MKSIFPEKMMMSQELTLESIIGKLTYFQEQLHLIHWSTRGYAEHMATGTLYEYIQGFRDNLVEKLMGYTNSRPSTFTIEPLKNISCESVIADMLLFATNLKSYAEKNGFLDVGNLADELSGMVAKTKYLLTLS